MKSPRVSPAHRMAQAPPVRRQEGASNFELVLSRDSFQFSACHFVASHGRRERIHGHDYRLSVRLSGSQTVGSDGYMVDQGHVRRAIEKTCSELDQRFLCPMMTKVIDITIATDSCQKQSVTLVCQDGSTFSFPKGDCALLPVVHTTTEEIAIYLWERILENVQKEYLLKRDVHTMQVNVMDGTGQETTFSQAIPRTAGAHSTRTLDVSKYIRGNDGGDLPIPFVIRESALDGDSSLDVSDSLSQGSNVRERAEV